ncbi:NAD(P)H-hydrate dehydratase [Desulfurivibrio sp. D14AmB]|uniref:NAD(P)H-hydrate dehydratase n=1 Tax=Desulfurivibrio sp. D14AmB TaxID=3374370 RepID=UPI00376EE2CA
MKLATAEQMRECDRLATTTFGIAGLTLMENAGRGAVEVLVRRFGPVAGLEIALLAGPGNNGGDALVMARLLNRLGARPWVLLLADPARISPDAAANLLRLKEAAVPVEVVVDKEGLAEVAPRVLACGLAVDGIFGTGLSRPLSGLFLAAVRLLNDFSGPVLALDAPSGLNSDSGQVLGEAVKAACTVTFALAKPGLLLPPGNRWAGTVEVVDIGMPPGVYDRVAIELELLTAPELAPWLSRRPTESHKGSFGHLLLLAGSQGKTGAALLAAQGALRGGVGLLSACVPLPLLPIFATALPELMTIPLPGSDRAPGVADLEVARSALAGKSALVLGPGLGTAPETVELVRTLYREQALPMVVDADALNILARTPEILGQAAGPRILTPHPGEMARLLGLGSGQVQQERRRLAEKLAGEQGVWVVLKGAGTVVAAPDGAVALNPTGNPGMATGGMGDVLAGLIGGLLGRGLSPWRAACLGVYVHGLAADLLAADLNLDFGYTASEVATKIPAAFNRLLVEGPSGQPG